MVGVFCGRRKTEPWQMFRGENWEVFRSAQSYLVIAVPTYYQPDKSRAAVSEDGVGLAEGSVVKTHRVHLQDLVALPAEQWSQTVSTRLCKNSSLRRIWSHGQ